MVRTKEHAGLEYIYVLPHPEHPGFEPSLEPTTIKVIGRFRHGYFWNGEFVSYTGGRQRESLGNGWGVHYAHTNGTTQSWSW